MRVDFGVGEKFRSVSLNVTRYEDFSVSVMKVSKLLFFFPSVFKPMSSLWETNLGTIKMFIKIFYAFERN